jgi:hypothetical protein
MKLNLRKVWIWLGVFCAVSASSYGQAAPSSVKSDLLGTWTLVSTEELLRDGHARPYPDLGPHAKGYLIYTADGHMCATLMKPGRALWKNDDEHATDTEKLSAAAGFTSYCGTYRVDEKKKIIVHLPEVAFLPNYIGVPQERPFTLQGDRLIFSGTERAGDVVRWTIVWRRASR